MIHYSIWDLSVLYNKHINNNCYNEHKKFNLQCRKSLILQKHCLRKYSFNLSGLNIKTKIKLFRELGNLLLNFGTKTFTECFDT